MKKLLSLLLACGTLTVHAALTLPSPMGDNMVLQRQTTAHLWGTADPGAKITATGSWDNKARTATAGPDGRWLVEVATPKAGGPYTVAFSTSTGDKKTIKNVLIGEVWICSGQSNMVHPVRGYANQPVDGSAEAIRDAPNHPLIRMFKVPLTDAGTPQEDCGGTWQTTADKDAVAGIAATAYFFALELNKQLGIPVGIIQSAWGSARAEAFMSPEAIAAAGGVDVEKLSAQQQVQKRPSLAYNGMIYPLRHYTARGFTWFQLPANRADYMNYPAVLTSLVSSWRTLWGDPKMPFINTQCGKFPWDGSADKITLPRMIEKQFDVRATIPYYWIATATDLGDPKEPHHPQKPVHGYRMALLALEHVYGVKGLHADAPDFESVKFGGGKAVVNFTNAEGGMVCRGERVLGFELSGADKKFHPAEAVIVPGTSRVEVSSAAVAEPVALRYAFRNYCLVDLYNQWGQTPRSYRTDRWDEVF